MRRVAAIAGFAWFAIVVGVYYRRAWSLLLTPQAWDLRAVRDVSAPPLLVASLVVAAIALMRTRRRLAPSLAALLAPVSVLGLLWPRGSALLPSFAEAVSRSIVSVAGAGLVLFDAYVLGALLLRFCRLDSSDWRERLLFRFALGFGAVSYLSLALALVGWYRPMTVAAGLAAVAVGGGIAIRRAADRGVQGRGARRPVARADMLWLTIACVALAIALVGALAPEAEYDALWYHLWLPKIWLQHGRPVDVLAEYISLYPMTWELVFGAGLATGGAVGAKLLHFACLLLVGLAVWQMTRRFFPSGSPWLASAFVVTVPTVLWEATTAYVDLAVAFYVTLGFYALLAFRETRDRAWFTIGAITLGLGAAIKHLGLIALVLGGLVLLVDLALRRDRRPARLLLPAVLVCSGVLIALPWYVRAWLASGNPFFPELYQIFGAWPATRWDAISQHGLDRFNAHFGLPRTPLNVLLLPWNVTMHGALFGGCLGPVFLLALPLFVARRLRTAPAAWLMFLVAGYLAVWASPIGSFQMRFLVPIVPALAVLSAAALTPLLQSRPGLDWSHDLQSRPGLDWRQMLRWGLVPGALAVVLVLNLPPFIPLHEGDRSAWNGWLTHVMREVPLRPVVGRQSQDDYLRQAVPTYGAWQHANARLPATARVLEFGGGDNFYAARDRVSADAPVARRTWAYQHTPAAASLAQTLTTLGITHVLFDKSELRRQERDGLVLASSDFRERDLTVEYEDRSAVLYRVRQESRRVGSPREKAGGRALQLATQMIGEARRVVP